MSALHLRNNIDINKDTVFAGPKAFATQDDGRILFDTNGRAYIAISRQLVGSRADQTYAGMKYILAELGERRRCLK